MKMELLTNATVVDDAIMFVTANSASKETTVGHETKTHMTSFDETNNED